ncbi:pyridoxamine 5'-phosphate oxidase family protein [Phenylobacterium sp.]|uniref:pyridoxamine 5'-phosphate oxidase family protein n=1 Tax=Phenylobacterium sp. TaxID=1871053 RepID=UPI0025F8D512|nr:pyridoxamine 5'-phosphate oxidase family protein [Phenylobacterium sp.]MBX3485395.1 pyridoxamine 5'-phosphate oxidase family protein [Phenylobacterium sp.]MCW5760497.1 pyridoxamine 5'-phosphate oxidase family protein [Phenylobacterium sp.]
MLDPELVRFLQGPVMILMASRTAEGRPAIARVLGCRVQDDGDLHVQVGARQWAEALGGLAPGDTVALTFVRPSDYRAVQVKGPLLSRMPGDAAADARATAYRSAMGAELLRLGILQPQIDQWVDLEPLAALHMRPSVVFDQTPGDGAGQVLARPDA